MFGGRGYYIVFALCLLAAGIIGYITLFDRGTEVQPKTPAVDVQPDTPTTPVVKPAPVVLPEPKIETAAETEAEAEITEPSVLLPQVVSPLSGETVTVFSMTELLYDATMADWRTHDGIDVQAAEGAAVKTAAAGVVQSVTDDELMGTTVVIQHDGGYTTRYSSLQQDVPVEEGQTVAAGDVIGCVGTTSAAEIEMGPHLHFSVSRDGAVIDPHEYVGEEYRAYGKERRRRSFPYLCMYIGFIRPGWSPCPRRWAGRRGCPRSCRGTGGPAPPAASGRGRRRSCSPPPP